MNIMLKKAVSIILVMLMALGGLNGLFVGGENAYAADGFAAGSGTSNDPYQIATAAELDLIRNYLGDDNKYFKLTADIDLTNYLSASGAGYNGGAGWVPIGHYYNRFLGNFDGNGFKIMNLTINLPEGQQIGFFGILEGTITNMILEDIDVKGLGDIGSIAGGNYGTISNSSVTGSVYVDPTRDDPNEGSNIGGLVGVNGSGGIINRSYSAVNISGNDNSGYTNGGLVGFNNAGTIANSYATGNVRANIGVGGLAGGNSGGTITNSYATGLVSGVSSVGGLLGSNNYNGSVNNSFYDSDTTKQSDTGKGEGKSTTDMQIVSTFTGWDFSSDWYIAPGQYPQLWAFTALSQGTNPGTTKLNNVATGMEYSLDGVHYTAIIGTSIDNIAVLSGDSIFIRVTGTSPLSPKTLIVDQANIKPVEFAGGNGEEATPYQIATAAQLSEVRNHLGVGIYFELIADIDLDVSPYNVGDGWVPIGNGINTEFEGNMDGNGFRIMNLRIMKEKISVNDYSNNILGFFGYIGSDSNISNIILENVDVSGYEGIGALAGVNKGTISNSSVTGSVYGSDAAGLVAYLYGGTINNSYSTANVDADTHSGGLVAYISAGTITNSYATGSVTVGSDTVGGLVGYNDAGTITNSYATGSVTAGPSADNVGGLVGYNDVGTITNSFYNRDTTGQVDEGKGLGLTTAEMRLWVFAALTQGTNPGTTKLNNVATDMEYSIDGAPYTAITDTSVDNIYTNVDDTISIRLALFPSSLRTWTIDTTNRKPDVAISTSAIAGVTAPVRDATPVTTVTETTYYTGTITWSSSPETFAASTAYTATITLTPKPGYILTGVPANFFTVAGATTTNAADSGVVTAVFPATADPTQIATAAIAGVTAPVRGATPVTTVTETTSYTGTVTWSSSPVTFAASTAYTATITLTPKAGYTFAGVAANFFTVTGATTTNTADSGVVTAVFPATADPTQIATAAIAGVTAPVRGATPVTTVTETTSYTGTVTWSSSPVTFAASTAYTATITLTPKAGYTFAGVAANFFTVTGATTTNTADSGVITAVFPATAANPTQSSSTTPPPATKVTSTDGKITVPAGSTGEVSLGDEATVSIPGDATNKNLELTIDKVENTQDLVKNNEVLVSPVFEIMKNFSENFTKPVTLTFVFDLAIVKSNQRVAVFYYDEVKKLWVEVGGGVVSVNKISVEVDHFTKFAVMAVDEVEDVPVKVDPSDTTTEIKLNDISGHWAETGIKQAVSIGFIKGYVDGTFKPNQTVTRAEFSVMLMNALKPEGAGVELTFTDKAMIGAWAQKAVAQAVQAGIINGYEDGTFRPNAEVTRSEMAVMIANALKLNIESDTVTSFADDKSIPSWAKGAVAELKKLSLMVGSGANQFNPNAQATRAEAVTVLLNMLALEN